MRFLGQSEWCYFGGRKPSEHVADKNRSFATAIFARFGGEQQFRHPNKHRASRTTVQERAKLLVLPWHDPSSFLLMQLVSLVSPTPSSPTPPPTPSKHAVSPAFSARGDSISAAAAAGVEVGDRSLLVRKCLAGEEQQAEAEEDSIAAAADARRPPRFGAWDGAGCIVASASPAVLW